MKMKTSELRDLVLRVLRKKFSEEDSELIADVIMFAEMAGKVSHGVFRLLNVDNGVMGLSPTAEPKLIHKTKVSSMIEANGAPGMLVGSLAMKEVIRLAKESGFGIVGTRGGFSSTGCLSYYMETIAKEDLIGIAMAQSLYSTAPHGGITPLFGTNPISFGIPLGSQPIVFDMSTAAITFGGIIEAQSKGIKLPVNVAIDKNGEMTQDPDEALLGATLAFDNSYKGSGLAMMVEILAGIWPGASFADQDEKNGWGNLFMAFSPDLLTSTSEFKKKARKLSEVVRNSKRKEGGEIRIPGERALSNRNRCLECGEVEVDDLQINKLRHFLER